MSVNGFLTRTVLDTALLLDATRRWPAPTSPRSRAAPSTKAATSRARDSLRIAASLKGTRALAPPMLDPRCRAAVEETAELLGSLGHQVSLARPRIGAGSATGSRSSMLRGSRGRRPPTAQSRAPRSPGEPGRPAGVAGSRVAPEAHQGGDPEARPAAQRDLRRRGRAAAPDDRGAAGARSASGIPTAGRGRSPA